MNWPFRLFLLCVAASIAWFLIAFVALSIAIGLEKLT